MAKTAPETNGINRWVKLSERVLTMLRDPLTLPAAFMLFWCWMGYLHIPPVAKGHIDLLRDTSATLKSMDETLVQSNRVLDRLVNQQYPSADFRKTVHDEHDQAQTTLDETATKIDDIHDAVVKE